MQKITQLVNELNDLKIDANNLLNKSFIDEKSQMIEDRISKLKFLKDLAELTDQSLVTEEDLVKNIAETAAALDWSTEKFLFELGVYALAWDKIN